MKNCPALPRWNLNFPCNRRVKSAQTARVEISPRQTEIMQSPQKTLSTLMELFYAKIVWGFHHTESIVCFQKKQNVSLLLTLSTLHTLTVCYYHLTYEFWSESTLHSFPECIGTPCSKQAPHLKVKWEQRDSNPQSLSS